jgi:hypothetical protein
MAELMLVNPKKRRAKRKATKRKTPARRRAAAPAKRKVTRRRRRNPIATTGIMAQVQNAAIGAAGAVVTDIAMAKLPMIPENMKTGNVGALTKGAVAVGLGMLVSKVMKNRKLGVQIAEGGLTVAMHTVAAGVVGDKLGIEMGAPIDSDESLLAYSSLNAYDSLGGIDDGSLLGAGDADDIFSDADDFGYISPAQVDDSFSL